MRMGSLFDGAGTCCFAAELCGIQPVWSSEIEKFPLEVTAKRFPKVKQLGDITKINGAEIEPVDIITFGSPCQDLSIAGKREGLDGERSGLFMGVDLGTGPDRTGCGFVYPKLKMGGRALFDKKTADTFTLIYAERRLRALQSWRYHKARPGWIRRRIKNLKRKIKTIRNRYSGDSEWLKNMDFIRNLI